MSDSHVIKLRAPRFLLSVAATGLLALVSLAIGVYGMIDGEWASATVTVPIGIVLGLTAFRMLNHAYLIDGSTLSYRNGVLGRVTRSVDLLDVVLVTLVMLGRRPRARITLWTPIVGEPRLSHRFSRMMGGDRKLVREIEARLGPLRAVPVDLDLIGGERQEPIWRAMDAAGLPVEGTSSFPVIRIAP